MTFPQFAYLLGMITGKGTIIRKSTSTEILIEIPHKNLIIEGMDVQLSVKASITDIKEILEPFIDTRISVISMENKTILSFGKDNAFVLIREINKQMRNLISCKDFRIPEEIYIAPSDIKKEFLRGLADVTAHIRSSNIAYSIAYNHRVYIEIPVNWFLTVDIANLLMDLDIPVQTIDWGHPNTRDPNLKDYNRGKKYAWFREHQIKIFADEFEKVGFKINHKMKALMKLAEINRKEWDKYVRDQIKTSKDPSKLEELEKMLGHIEIVHHKYYWETRDRNKPKPYHPMENDSRIPCIIRERHFDTWKSIAKTLGYPLRQ
jgi:hypothetical protein